MEKRVLTRWAGDVSRTQLNDIGLNAINSFDLDKEEVSKVSYLACFDCFSYITPFEYNGVSLHTIKCPTCGKVYKKNGGGSLCLV